MGLLVVAAGLLLLSLAAGDELAGAELGRRAHDAASVDPGDLVSQVRETVYPA